MHVPTIKMSSVQHALLHGDRRITLGTLGVLAGAIVVVAAVCMGSSSSAPPEPTASASPPLTPAPTVVTPPPVEASPLNGVLIPTDEIARLKQRPPLAVMVENFIDARPQAGLDRADIVYEAVAEGGITRFLAVYWRNDAGRIHYLRSARIYYIHWAAELGAVYVHWGQVEDPGPVDVWPVLARLNIPVLNGLFLGEEVGYRDETRYAPHNVYTDTGRLWTTSQAHGWAGPPTLQPWPFKEDDPKRVSVFGSRSASVIELSFGNEPGSPYAVRWDYDPASNGYVRTMAGAPHTDAVSGARLAARNVIVQQAVLRPSGVKAYNIIDTVGAGTAVIFQDGVAVEGTWRKDAESSRTRFYDAAGNEIPLNRGQTWVEVVPTGSAIAY